MESLLKGDPKDIKNTVKLEELKLRISEQSGRAIR